MRSPISASTWGVNSTLSRAYEPSSLRKNTQPTGSAALTVRRGAKEQPVKGELETVAAAQQPMSLDLHWLESAVRRHETIRPADQPKLGIPEGPDLQDGAIAGKELRLAARRQLDRCRGLDDPSLESMPVSASSASNGLSSSTRSSCPLSVSQNA